MYFIAIVELLVCWFGWGYPFIFRTPKRQSRESVEAPLPTFAGLLLQAGAIFMAWAIRLNTPPAPWRVMVALVLCPFAPLISWSAVRHLGRQFRIHAGVYVDHELVREGPYATVRHPIYLSLLIILTSTLLLLTPWLWCLVSLGLFLLGTEVRIHAEEKLLAQRFGAEFEAYRSKISAYIPFLR
jgi:protein-S-isoprenylcysteine O-methyltransferase Ste14